MSDVLTGGASGAAWDRVVETAYDRTVQYYLRDEPQWRDFIDMHPMDQAMPGEIVTLTIHQAFASLSTSPLTETVDVGAVAAAAPNRVNVALEEFGFAAITTFRLRQLAFTQVDPEIAELVGYHMLDSVDAIVRSVADTGTNTLAKNGGTGLAGTLVTGGNVNNILVNNVMDRDLATISVKLLRRRKAKPRIGRMYLGVIHPDVSYDLQSQDSATAWNAPHTEGTDTAAIYSGDIGGFQGAQYVETTRCTIANNTATTPIAIYNTYYLGRQAIVEASASDPGVVLGPVTDHLRRFNPIGWLALFGHSIYREEAMVITQSASSLATLA